MHPGELWVSKQRVHLVLEASKSAGAKGDVPKICGFVHPLHPLYRIPCLSTNKYAILNWKTTQISLICWRLSTSNSSVASSIAHWSIDWREWPMTASITSSIQKIPIWERLESLQSWGSLQCWAEQQKPRGWWQPLGSFPPSFLHSLCWLLEWVQLYCKVFSIGLWQGLGGKYSILR